MSHNETDVDRLEVSQANASSHNGGKSSSAVANKENTRTASRSRSRSLRKDDDRDRSSRRRRSRDRRSHSRDQKRDVERSRDRSRDRRRKSRSRSRNKRRHSRSKDRVRRRSRSRSPRERRSDWSRSKDHRRRSRSRDRRRSPRRRRSASRSPNRSNRGPSPFQRKGGEDMSCEERDLRTVFCMQLSQRIRARDLDEFFSSVGKVRDVRMIVDNKTRKSKGIAYVEFVDLESVPLAMGLNGQKLFGVPIIVQPTQAERNRQANQTSPANPAKGPMRLYVGSLHFDISEQMLKELFETFGKLDRVEIIKDESGKSKGYGFVTFHEADCAKKALEHLNGIDIAGRPIKVGNVTERGLDGGAPSILDNEELDRTGIELGNTGRLVLMAKLAVGTGIELPDAAKTALQQHMQQSITSSMSSQLTNSVQHEEINLISTQCFLLSNMFDPGREDPEESSDQELRVDVLEECRKHGGAVHVHIDKASGSVYVKCPTIATAGAAVGALHGRYFAGRLITAAYVPVKTYHELFPDSVHLKQAL